MHAAIIFSRFGPYHIARLEAAGRRLRADGGTVTGIETTSTGAVYAWAPVEGGTHFNKVTLFPDVAHEDVSRSRIAAALHDQLDALAPDVVAIPGWRMIEALSALDWAAAHATPTILMSESTRIDARRRPVGEAIKRRIVAHCNAALVGGQRHVEYLSDLGMPPDRVALGYDTVDNQHFVQGADAAREHADALRADMNLPQHYFLASCRFIQKKNLSRVLDAYHRYQAAAGPDAWHLVLCGDGPLRRELETQVATLNLTPYVHFHGFREYDELPAYYGLAGAFIQASTVEQWGLVVNEAAASGIPVLVSHPTGSITELLVEGENGFGFDPYDVDALVGLMKRVADADCDRVAMGRRSRAIVSQWDADRFGAGLADAMALATEHPPQPLSLIDRFLIRILSHL